MVSRSAVSLIDGSAGSATLARNAFDVPSTVAIGGAPKGWTGQPTMTFTALGTPTSPGSLEYAVAHNLVPRSTKDVLYDDEDWALTPRAEQTDPGAYMAKFVKFAHAHGYKAVLAPGMDLTNAMACHKASDSAWVNYVTDCKIPQLAGRAGPDLYEVQSQRYESGAPLGVLCGCFAWLVTQSAVQARTAAPLLPVFAGLSTNEDGVVATARSLYDDTESTAASAGGYWLNVPERSRACPQCVTGGAPQVAVQYLEMLGYSS
jgi:hypothetical protein